MTWLLQGDEMVSKEEFAAIWDDFVMSQEFMDMAHELRRGMDFPCHHNAYLVAGFLERLGHESLRCISGYYQCRDQEKRIHHSWIKLARDGKTLAILELDPRQLHEAGGYKNDLMPSGYVPEMAMNITGIASIVDPNLVELSKEAKESPWVVSSKEVLLRYVEGVELVPEIDFADLDDLGFEAQEEFDLYRELRNENGRE
jgi:hypothetical protein